MSEMETASESEERYCGGCGKLLRRRKNESRGNFRKRKHCGDSCHARKCAYRACRKLLVRREDESADAFRRRTHCDKSCSSKRHMSERKAGNVRTCYRRGLCPEGEETEREIQRVERRKAILRRFKEAEAPPPAPAVEISVVPLKAFFEPEPQW